ncbi:hypothetical protein ASG89_21920 [Paenibacillus sp. Soil766]|uniref:hypothetical protein n=1 Tax=Paenibacillus sp. Soil766 TaxID=1736404 RepID=UPI0007108B56|nr:hypothetical protein [Paenibacillus sp. Soil766]KRF04505.1 hypothetical protein ASG89_21920 [Paenibacillus sp. Soil766]
MNDIQVFHKGDITLVNTGVLVSIGDQAYGWFDKTGDKMRRIAVLPNSILKPNLKPNTHKGEWLPNEIEEMLTTGHISAIGNGQFKVLKAFQGSVSGTKVAVHDEGSNSGYKHWTDPLGKLIVNPDKN